MIDSTDHPPERLGFHSALLTSPLTRAKAVEFFKAAGHPGNYAALVACDCALAKEIFPLAPMTVQFSPVPGVVLCKCQLCGAERAKFKMAEE